MKTNPTPDSSKSGSILIAALWTVVLLSMIVSALVFDMQVEARITSYYRKRLKAGHLAMGGMERARMLLVRSYDEDIADEDAYEDADAWWYRHAKALAQGSHITNMVEELETGAFFLSVTPEPAKRNVNLLTKEDWERVLEVGGIPEENWEKLIESFLDWTDADDKVRNRGAETEDYYEQLGIVAKNGPLFRVDELYFVRYFSDPVIDENTPEDAVVTENTVDRIRGMLTVYGSENKVNVNAADKTVLMTLPGVDEEAANEIITERSAADEDEEPEPFEDINDFFSRVRGLNRGQLASFITVGSKVYQINSVGTSYGVSRRLSCTVEVDDKGLVRVLRWTESDGA